MFSNLVNNNCSAYYQSKGKYLRAEKLHGSHRNWTIKFNDFSMNDINFP